MNTAPAIVSDKQLGDVLLLQPSARHLADAHGAPTALFVREAFKPLVELMPGCMWGPDATGRFDEVWTMNWSSHAVWRAFRLKTRRRLLIVNKPRHVRWWYRWMFHEIKQEPPSPKYWGLYFWEIVSGGHGRDFVPPQLRTPPAEWRHAEAPAGDFLLINPTAAWSRKFWSVPQWAEVIGALAGLQAMPVVIAGGGSEREKEHCQAIAAASRVPVLNLAGRTSMREYLHMLSSARLVLCIDGAASHLAQAFGVPTVTVFGPTPERKWHWPTPRHRVLAARHFAEPADVEPGGILSADHVPATAMLGEALTLLGRRS